MSDAPPFGCDGLPRLAHPVAKAAPADTGVLDTEIDLLRAQLNQGSAPAFGQ